MDSCLTNQIKITFFGYKESTMISAKILREKGIVQKMHSSLTTGRHSMEYIFKEKIFLDSALFGEIVSDFEKLSHEFSFNIITGPAQAGAIFASNVAFLREKPFIFPEKAQNEKRRMYFRKSFADIIPGKKFLVIEDNITTGGSIDQIIIAISQLGGEIVGILSLWNRENYQPQKWAGVNWSNERIPLISLIEEKIPSYDPDDKINLCPGCIEGLRLINPKT
jgi:orotate phosphoribosyltransferase